MIASEMDETYVPFQTAFKPLDELSFEELRGEIASWRNLWTWVDENVKAYLARIGEPVRLITRNYKGFFGVMQTPHFDLKEVEVAVEGKEYDYNTGNYFWERKVVRLPVSAIVWFEYVQDRAPIEDDVKPYQPVEPSYPEDFVKEERS